MKNDKIIVAGTLVLALLMAMPAWAQNGDGRRGPGAPGGRPGMMGPMGPGPGPADADGRSGRQGREVNELVQAYMTMRLSRDLNLNDEQTVILMRRLDDMQTERQELRKDRQERLKALREALKGEASEKAVKTALTNLRDSDQQMHERRMDMMARLADGLSVIQQAKLYVALDDFEDNMRRMVQRARANRPGGPGGPGMGPGHGGPGMGMGPGGPGMPPPPEDSGQNMFAE